MAQDLGILLENGNADLLKYIKMRWAFKGVAHHARFVKKEAEKIEEYMKEHDLKKIEGKFKSMDKDAHKTIAKHHTVTIIDLVILASVLRDLKKFGHLMQDRLLLEHDYLKIKDVSPGMKTSNLRTASRYKELILEELKKEKVDVEKTKRIYYRTKSETEKYIRKLNKLINGLNAETKGRTDWNKLMKDVFFIDNVAIATWKQRRGEHEEFRKAKEVHSFIKKLEKAERKFRKLVQELKKDKVTENLKKIANELKKDLKEIHKDAPESLTDMETVAKDAFVILVTDSMYMRRMLRTLDEESNERLKRWAQAHEVPEVMYEVQKKEADKILQYCLVDLQDERKGVLQSIGILQAVKP